MRTLIIVFFFFYTTLIFSKTIKTEIGKLKIEIVAKGLGIPWGMAFMSKNTLLVSDRKGILREVDISSGQVKKISGVPSVYAEGQGGLLDVALHPNFSKNRQVYLSYSIPQGKGGNTLRVARGKLMGTKLQNLSPIFTAKPGSTKNIHFGSRLAFDNKGFLFFGVGDRGMRPTAQDLSTHHGKIIRLHDDGKIPQDNPFVGRKNARDEIWSYGHRNPQGLSFRPGTSELWEHEHGPRGGDEINLIKKGQNYGWPVITYGREYYGPKIGTTAKKGMMQPVKYFVPSIAPSGMVFYSGTKIPSWKGNLFMGSLVLTHLNRSILKENRVVHEERVLNDWGRRVRNVSESPDGYLYFTTDNGELVRVVPN